MQQIIEGTEYIIALQKKRCIPFLSGDGMMNSITLPQVVTQLLTHPPYDLNSLKKYAQGYPLSRIRLAILEEIKEKRISAKQQDRLSCLFRTLGVQGIENALCEILDDSDLSDDVRASAMAALFHSELGQQKFEALDAVLRIRLSTPWIRPMMELCAYELFPRLALSELFFSTPLYARPTLIFYFEKCRSQVAAPTSAAYVELINKNVDQKSLENLFQILSEKEELKDLSAIIHQAPTNTQRMFYQWLNIDFQTDEQIAGPSSEEMEIDQLIEEEIEKLKKQ